MGEFGWIMWPVEWDGLPFGGVREHGSECEDDWNAIECGEEVKSREEGQQVIEPAVLLESRMEGS